MQYEHDWIPASSQENKFNAHIWTSLFHVDLRLSGKIIGRFNSQNTAQTSCKHTTQQHNNNYVYFQQLGIRVYMYILLWKSTLFFWEELTCPAGVAAAVATHWVTAVSMGTVTALTTLQTIGAILTVTWIHCVKVSCGYNKLDSCSILSVRSPTYRTGLVAVLSSPPWRTCADSIHRVTRCPVVT